MGTKWSSDNAEVDINEEIYKKAWVRNCDCDVVYYKANDGAVLTSFWQGYDRT